MTKRTENQPLIPRVANPSRLTQIGQFFHSHRRAINVGVDCASTLAPFQVANNMLQGWPDSYYDNLIKLNFAFAIYFLAQLAESIAFHRQRNEDNNAPRLLSTLNLMLFTFTMLCYITDSLQDNLIAVIAQETNPQGGANSVSADTFWHIDFGIPVSIALAYSASQFGKGMYSILTKNRQAHLLNPAPTRIPPAIKSKLKIADKIGTFLVDGVAVYGSLFQDVAYYSLSYAGVNLMNYPQYATTVLYGSGAALGLVVAGLFEGGAVPKVISKQQFEKVVIASGSALGLSVFYTSNIAETRATNMNVATMFTMAGIPLLMVFGAGVYATVQYVSRSKKQPVFIEPHVEEAPASSSDSSSKDGLPVEHAYIGHDVEAPAPRHSSSSAEEAPAENPNSDLIDENGSPARLGLFGNNTALTFQTPNNLSPSNSF